MLKIVKIRAKKAFAPIKIPGVDYVINQYVGCELAYIAMPSSCVGGTIMGGGLLGRG